LFVKDAIIDQGKVKDVDFGQEKAAGELFQKVKKDGPLPSYRCIPRKSITRTQPCCPNESKQLEETSQP